MSDLREIKIKIDRDGKVTLDVNGVKGTKCLKATEELEKVLGKVDNKELKPEYFEENLNDNLNYSPTLEDEEQSQENKS